MLRAAGGFGFSGAPGSGGVQVNNTLDGVIVPFFRVAYGTYYASVPPFGSLRLSSIASRARARDGWRCFST